MRNVSVIGDGNVGSDHELYRVAEKVGRLVAERGYVLVCGGLYGVMEGASKGAKEAGGLTVGILPDYSFSSNPYVDVKVVTGMGQARNVIVVSSSELVIAVGGGYGTLSEIAHAIKLRRRVIGYKTWKVEGLEYHDEETAFLDCVARAL